MTTRSKAFATCVEPEPVERRGTSIRHRVNTDGTVGPQGDNNMYIEEKTMTNEKFLAKFFSGKMEIGELVDALSKDGRQRINMKFGVCSGCIGDVGTNEYFTVSTVTGGICAVCNRHGVPLSTVGPIEVVVEDAEPCNCINWHGHFKHEYRGESHHTTYQRVN